MRSAIYYPHTEFRNINLLKTSLLLWDNVEFIVPYEGYKFEYRGKLTAKAVELIGRKRCPDESEKAKAHDLIEDFATGTLPENFFYSESTRNQYYRYGMWPQKLLPKTWEMLSELQLVGQPLADADYPLQDSAGLALMSILADCCAGETRTRITDRGSAYAALTNLLVDKSRDCTNHIEQVIPITLKLIDTSDIPLESLIKFRERERKEGGHTIRELRRNYANRISSHLKEMSNAKSKADLIILNERFEHDMQDDLSNLHHEITSAKQDIVLSKEFLATTVAAVGSLWAAMHGLPVEIMGALGLGGSVVTAGGLAVTGKKYASTRLATLKKHPMAYLYELQRRY